MNVKRRFSDFEWLHQILVNNYNYCLIPSIPKKKKKIFTDNFDETFLRRRARIFEKFLNYLINDPILKNSEVIFDFLSIEKEENFLKKKKIYEKKKLSTNINDYFTVDGNANIEINGEKEYYINIIKDNAQNNENILKKINSSIRSLRDDLINVSNQLKDISYHFKLIKKEQKMILKKI